MRSCERAEVGFVELRKYLGDHIVRRISLFVVLFKERLLNCSVPRNVNVAGKRHSLREIYGVQVQDAKPLDDHGLGIGQERILYAVAVGELLEDRLIVITDRH